MKIYTFVPQVMVPKPMVVQTPGWVFKATVSSLRFNAIAQSTRFSSSG